MRYKKQKNYWQQDIQLNEYLLALFQGGSLIIIVSYLFYGTFLGAILLSPYLFRYIKSWEKQVIKKKKRIFQLQFKELISSLEVALSVGYSMENAMREAIKELKKFYKGEELILKELEYMIRQQQLNIPIETVWQEFAKRTKEEHVQTFSTAFVMAKRSGGDTLEIIRNVVRQMCEKIDVERDIDTLMAAKKMEFRIMSAIPFGMILYLRISFPDLLRVLYGNTVGMLIMSICLGIYVLAYEFGKRIVEIEV